MCMMRIRVILSEAKDLAGMHGGGQILRYAQDDGRQASARAMNLAPGVRQG
jgi:hypothetical protein